MIARGSWEHPGKSIKWWPLPERWYASHTDSLFVFSTVNTHHVLRITHNATRVSGVLALYGQARERVSISCRVQLCCYITSIGYLRAGIDRDNSLVLFYLYSGIIIWASFSHCPPPPPMDIILWLMVKLECIVETSTLVIRQLDTATWPLPLNPHMLSIPLAGHRPLKCQLQNVKKTFLYSENLSIRNAENCILCNFLHFEFSEKYLCSDVISNRFTGLSDHQLYGLPWIEGDWTDPGHWRVKETSAGGVLSGEEKSGK